MSQKVPSLFLIGAQKGGSTNLASHLEQSPQIAYFGRKEPNIFSLGSEAKCRAKLNSIDIAEDAPPLLLDGSPDYSRAPYIDRVPEMIAQIIGKQAPKFIYSLRDPVERTISHYFWSREKFGETYSFEEAIERDARYIDASRYDMQIDRYLEVFDIDQFYFVKFENYIADPLAHLPPLLEWAGATMPDTFNPKPEFDAATDKVSTKEALFPMANRLARKQGIVRNLVQAIVPTSQHQRLARALSKSVPRPEISQETKQWLRETYFMKTIERTAELTGLDLSDWLAPKAAQTMEAKAD
jgi:hypothetical protein